MTATTSPLTTMPRNHRFQSRLLGHAMPCHATPSVSHRAMARLDRPLRWDICGAINVPRSKPTGEAAGEA